MKQSKKNYLNLTLILLGTILLTIGSTNLYKNYEEEKLSTAYISKYVSVVQYNELDNALLELGTDTFLYISYTGDKDIHKFETKFKKVLRDNEILDNVLYLNVNEKLNDENYIKDINKKLNLKEHIITKLPSIIYYKDGKVIDVINSDPSIIDTGKFMQLIDKHEVIE